MPEMPAAPAVPEIPSAPAAPALPPVPAAPELAAEDAQAVRGVAIIAAAGAGAIYLLNTVTLPAFFAANAVALFIAASACVAAWRWVRGGVRRQARAAAAGQIREFGGGAYGAVAAATLLYLEGTDMAAEVAAAGSLQAFMEAMDVAWLIEQGIESIGFAIHAGLWPWYWLSEFGVKTAFLVALAVWALDAVLGSLARRGSEASEAAA